MSVATVDMRDMSDEELRELFASDQAVAALAEAERRDTADQETARGRARTDKARQALKAIRGEWEEAAYAQYLAADAECRGNLLSKAGEAAVTSELSLWRHSTADAHRFASEELNDFWEKWPRVSLQAYTRQRAAAIRAAKADKTTSGREASYGDRVDADRRPAVDGHDARRVRPGSAASAVRRAGHTPVTEASTDRGTAAGSVQRGRGVNIGEEAATAARVAANVDRHMTAGREAAERRLAAARDGAGISGAVVRRPATSPVRAPVDGIPGDQLLDLLRKWIGTYARLPSPAALDAVTLWVAHSHMRDEKGTLVFRATPRLYLLSSEPGSGKSKVLELCNMLCPATYGLTLEPTAAGLTHTIGNEHATVFIDEGDVMFGAGQRKSAVRAVINGGYERHGTMLNGKGSKATRVPVFGALALAGLDVLEKGTGDTLTALLSRGVRIRMKKAGKDDRPAKVTRVTEGQGEKMRAWLEAWAGQVRDSIKDYQPEMPEEVDGRPEQIWEPLVAVADVAGGEWPERARAACIELALDQATAPVEDEEESTAEAFASFATDLGGALADTTPDYGDDEEV